MNFTSACAKTPFVRALAWLNSFARPWNVPKSAQDRNLILLSELPGCVVVLP